MAVTAIWFGAQCGRAETVPTTTTLAISSVGGSIARGGSVSSGSAVTLSATVMAGTAAVTVGQVNFCDASAPYCTDIHLLGTAQLTGGGLAVFRLMPGIGSHAYKAVFLGTPNGVSAYAGSNSTPLVLCVTMNAAWPTATAIEQSGDAGNVTLTATVGGTADVPPTGTVSFLDASNGNTVMATAPLASTTAGLTFLNSSSPKAGNAAYSVAVGDFNKDGIPDLAIANYKLSQTNGTVKIYLGKGDGTFTATATSPTVGAGPVFVTTGDFNKDGITDLAVANYYDRTVTVLMGSGDGTFASAPGQPPATGAGPVFIAVADFDRNGIPDLAVANENGNTLTVLLGNGDGTFAPASSPATGNMPDALAAADFNGDGIPDLAVTDFSSDSITLLLGVGDGTFTFKATIPAGSGPYAIVAGNFRGKGIMDLAVAHYSQSSNVAILLGNGDGTFTQAASPATGSYSESIAVGDFNRNGVADLAVSNSANNTVTVLLGNGNGTFTATTKNPGTGTGSHSIAVADFNGDGTPDLAVANMGSATVTVLLAATQTATTKATAITVTAGSGTDLAVATYLGDSTYVPSTSVEAGLIEQLATPSVTVTPSPSTVTTAQALTATIDVNGGTGNLIPTGAVRLSSGSYTSALQPLTNNGAVITVPAGALAAGTDMLMVNYSGDGNYLATTGSAAILVAAPIGTAVSAVTVTPLATTMTDAQTVVVAVSVTGASGQATPTGNIVLTTGSYSESQPLTTGVADFIIPAGTFVGGGNTISASYTGDATYGAGAGTASITISQATFAVPMPATVSPGGTATTTVTVSAGSTYAGTLNLTCTLSNYPAGAKSLPICNLNPSSVTVLAGGTITAGMTVRTTAASDAAQSKSIEKRAWELGGGGAGVALALMWMWGIPARRRRWTPILLLLLVVAATAEIGCTAGIRPGTVQAIPSTTAGNYVFTLSGVDAANPAITASATVIVTVQ